MSHFTDEEIQILNEWARSQPALRNAFPYTSSSDDGRGLGTLLDQHGDEVVIVRQTDGLQSLVADTISFNIDSFYVTHGVSGEAIINFRGTAGSGSGTPGITDHGDLTGLEDDDHPQYLLRTETPPGFYGIVIRESDGSFATRDDTIEFDSSDFNVANVSDKPRVTVLDSGIDHGGLGGLGDDDHPQYLLRTEQSPGFYGIIIKESDNSYAERDDTIVFNSSDFEVATVGGKPQVSIVDSGIDHGSLSGLTDDDHPQYARKQADWNTFRQGITAEAFYTESGEIRPWDVNSDHFYISKDGDGTSIINLRHEFVAKHITVQNPSRREDITWFVAESDLRVKSMVSFLRTSDSGFYPYAKFSVRFGGGIPTSPGGTELTTGGWTLGFYPGHPYLTENPLRRDSFNNPNIPGGDFVWLQTTDIGEGYGIEEELHVTLKMTRN